MRIIMTIIWAFLIVAALNYILTSMAQIPFNMTQTITYTICAIIGVLLVDGILSAALKKNE